MGCRNPFLCFRLTIGTTLQPVILPQQRTKHIVGTPLLPALPSKVYAQPSGGQQLP